MCMCVDTCGCPCDSRSTCRYVCIKRRSTLNSGIIGFPFVEIRIRMMPHALPTPTVDAQCAPHTNSGCPCAPHTNSRSMNNRRIGKELHSNTYQCCQAQHPITVTGSKSIIRFQRKPEFLSDGNRSLIWTLSWLRGSPESIFNGCHTRGFRFPQRDLALVMCLLISSSAGASRWAAFSQRGTAVGWGSH